MTGGPQHPDEPTGGAAAGVVVGHDRVVVADAEVSHRRGELVGRGQGMAPGGGLAGARQVPPEIDVDGAGEVAPGVVLPAGWTAEAPPDLAANVRLGTGY